MMERTHSELHTHLMGMLSLKGLLKLLYKMGYPGFPVNHNGELDFDNPVMRIEPTEKICRALVVPMGEHVEYAYLDVLYTNRPAILADLAKTTLKYTDMSERELLDFIYSEYLNASLEELIDQEVDYVEISSSNSRLMAYLLENIPDSTKDKIKVTFLLCTDRVRPVKNLSKDVDNLEAALQEGFGIGFDFMGREVPFDYTEVSKKKPSNSVNSFTAKLDMIIETLKDYPNSVLRIHAGENEESRCNPLLTLKMIDQIATQRGIKIPPPEIRLGHAIYFDDCDEYLELLKRYKCIVEINAVSNLALSNISNIYNIPYNYYLDNGIPVVLSTDGAGVYDTSIPSQNEIAALVAKSNNLEAIRTIDKKLLAKKLRGN